MIEKNAKGVPCHCCGAPAVKEVHNFPVCEACAKLKEYSLKKEASFDA